MDVFLFDRAEQKITKVSNCSTTFCHSTGPTISSNGRYISFTSKSKVYVYDRVTSNTEIVSIASNGTEAIYGSSYNLGISADGRYVAFSSRAPNFASGVVNSSNDDIFIRDRSLDITSIASISSYGTRPYFGINQGALSSDGNFLSFSADNSNFPGIASDVTEVYIHQNKPILESTPKNDTLNKAELIEELPFLNFINTRVANTELEHIPSCQQNPEPPANSVWFRYEPTVTSLIKVDTELGTDYPTLISVWSNSGGSLNEITCKSSNAQDEQPNLIFNAIAGHVYFIQASQNEDSGGGLLAFHLDETQGNFASRLEITASSNSADLSSPLQMTVTAYDDTGAKATSYDGTVSFISDDPHPRTMLPHAHSFVPGTGEFHTVVSFETPGPRKITVTDSENNLESVIEILVSETKVVGSGEIYYADHARLKLDSVVSSGSQSLHFSRENVFYPGDEIVILTLTGPEMGTSETAIIASIDQDSVVLQNPLQNNYDGTNNSVVVQRIPFFPSIVIGSGGVITASPWDGETGGIVYLRTDNFTVSEGGKIDVSGKGYNSPEEVGELSTAQGAGSYGGFSGDRGREPYGSVSEPNLFGSCGVVNSAGTSQCNRIGGGFIHLEIFNTLLLDGDILVNGDDSSFYNGAAGGSIFLRTKTLAGLGSLEANGGSGGQWNNYFGGSGGRVSIEFSENSFEGSIQAFGGYASNGENNGGGPGTIFVKETVSGSTSLLIDNNGEDGPPAVLFEPGNEATAFTFSKITLKGNGDLDFINPNDSIVLTSTNMSGDGSGQLWVRGELDYPLDKTYGFGFYVTPGATINLSENFSASGEALTNYGTLGNIEGVSATNLIIEDGDTDGSKVFLSATGHSAGFEEGKYQFNNVVVYEGNILELAGDPVTGKGVDIHTNNFNVYGKISADEHGYTPENNGPGAPTDINCGGAGHGGKGGGTCGGIAYGDDDQPTTLGSAGDASSGGGNGGGAIHLIVDGELRIHANGVISANGGYGAAAGGSIWLEADRVTGSGKIHAKGGPTYETYEGSGGGRISINAREVDQAIFDNRNVDAGNTGSLESRGYNGSLFPERPEADPRISSQGPKSAAKNSVFPYDITINNPSNAYSATDVMLTISLPADLQYVSHSGSTNPQVNGSQLIWDIGSMDPMSSITFAVFVRISPTAESSTLLTTNASITTGVSGDHPANNTSIIETEVYEEHDFTAKFDAEYQATDWILSQGASRTFKVSIKNTGWGSDSFSIVVDGLDTIIVDLPENSVQLAPGETKVVDLTLLANDCLVQGEKPLSIRVQSGHGQEQVLTATLSVQSEPIISNIRPDNNATVGSRNVQISWDSNVSSTGSITIYPVGQPELAQAYEAAPGLKHIFSVNDLSRNTTYEWSLITTSSCGLTTIEGNKFTVGNGIVFERQPLSHTINRDYNQVIKVAVKNTDSVEHKLRLDVHESYEDLIVNFVGDGSSDNTITLAPGQRQMVSLAVHAQDVIKRGEETRLQITAVLTADDDTVPITDTATINLLVLFPNDFSIEQIGFNEVFGVYTYRITNHGLPLTDLSVQAENKDTGQSASVFLRPNIAHAYLRKDQSLTFEVVPIFGPEDFLPSTIAVHSGGKVSLLMLQSDGTSIIVDAAGTTKEFKQGETICPVGKKIFRVHRDNVYMRISADGTYCTNKPDIEVKVDVPWFVDPDKIIGANLKLDNYPKGDEPVQPHTTTFKLNEHEIGVLDLTVPQGTYYFDIRPGYFNRGSTGVVQQTIQIDSEHPNEGHYQVANNFELGIALTDLDIYVCAETQAQAEQIVDDLYGLDPLPESVSVRIDAPLHGSTVEPGTDGTINLKAFVDDTNDEYHEYYSTVAKIVYLDQLFGTTEEVRLYDNGDEQYGDGVIADRNFNAIWVPRYSGRVRMTITAEAPNGLSDTKTVEFTVRKIPDLVVTKVYLNKVSLINQQAQIKAEVTNNGNDVAGPIIVVFKYYEADSSGKRTSKLIHQSTHTINGTFRRGQIIEIQDNQFTPTQFLLYYVDVIIDP